MFQGIDSPSLAQFLADYWQKKPCLIRQAFPGFVPQLDENDIAGLACDELAEARLITGSFPQHDWRVAHGPFTENELRNLPDNNWTLLVQDVEKHYPPLMSLLAHFNFLPKWRLDDLMVSVAAAGGSVGPHFDHYDVFLLQASGNRRWQIATHFAPALLADCELKVLASFSAEAEWDLTAGDILYLPPGVAHHGVALDTGMTWSIGLRAPSQADLLQGLGEWLAEYHDEGERFMDGEMEEIPRAGEINSLSTGRITSLLRHVQLSPRQLNTFLGSFLTRFRLAQQPAPPDQTIGEDEIMQALGGSATLQRNPWTRLAWIEQDGMARLFAAGEEYDCSIEIAALICANPVQLPDGFLTDPVTRQLVCNLINDGHLFLART